MARQSKTNYSLQQACERLKRHTLEIFHEQDPIVTETVAVILRRSKRLYRARRKRREGSLPPIPPNLRSESPATGEDFCKYDSEDDTDTRSTDSDYEQPSIPKYKHKDDVKTSTKEAEDIDPITIEYDTLVQKIERSKKADAKEYDQVIQQATKRVAQLCSINKISESCKEELGEVIKRAKGNLELLAVVSRFLNSKEYEHGQITCVSFSNADQSLLDRLAVEINHSIMPGRESDDIQRNKILHSLSACCRQFNFMDTGVTAYCDSFQQLIAAIRKCFGHMSEMTARSLIDNHIAGCTILAKTSLHTVFPELWISKGTEGPIRIQHTKDGWTETVYVTGRIDYAVLTTQVGGRSGFNKLEAVGDVGELLEEGWRNKIFTNKRLQDLVQTTKELHDSPSGQAAHLDNDSVDWDIMFIEAKRCVALVDGKEKAVPLTHYLPQMCIQVLAAHTGALSNRQYIKFCLSNGLRWLFGVFDAHDRSFHILDHELDTSSLDEGFPPVTLVMLYIWMCRSAKELLNKLELKVVLPEQ